MTTSSSRPGAPRLRLAVDPELAGLRLDQMIAAATTASRRRARALAGAGRVRRNGITTKVLSRPVAAWDVIELEPDDGEPLTLTRPAPEPAELLWEDGWLVFTAKPAGVLSQPSESSRGRERAWDERVAATLALRDGRPPFLRLVHRLDRATSGVLLFASRREALAPLARAWRSHRAERLYVAVVDGAPEADRLELDLPIGRDPAGGWRFVADPRGQAARTLVQVVDRRTDGRSVVLCSLQSGRTHQVRVHLAAAGHPVVGDRLYGGPRGERPLLHALALTVPHPAQRRLVRVTAPLPDDLSRWCPTGAEQLVELSLEHGTLDR